MATPSRLLANKRFREKAYDVITFEADKGKKAIYKAGAAELGLSLRMLIQNGVEEYIANHGCKEVVPVKPASVQPSAEEKRLLQNLASLPKSTRAKFVSLLEEVAKLAEQKGADSNGDSGRTD